MAPLDSRCGWHPRRGRGHGLRRDVGAAPRRAPGDRSVDPDRALIRFLDWPPRPRRPVARCSTPRAAASRPSATPSTARPTARSTPRSCSGSRASPAARPCSTTSRRRRGPTRSSRRREIRLEEADDGYHHHRLIDAAGVEPHGDAITGRIPLFFNGDIVMGVVRPAEAMPDYGFYRNGEADELLYVHEGRGLLDTVFGPLRYGPGDYLVLPIGTTWRLEPDAGQPAADALPRVPVGDRAAEALPQRLRPAPRALALLAARHPAARRGRRPGPTTASSRSTSRCATA